MPRVALMLALAGAIAVGVASGASRASANGAQPSVYADAAGDSATAPDLTKVTITPGSGSVSLDVQFTGALGADGSIGIGLDSDRNPQTGHGGLDYLFILYADGFFYGKWDGTDFQPFDHQTVSASLGDSEAQVILQTVDFGNVSTFDFVVVSLRGDDSDGVPEDGMATFPLAPPAPTVKAVVLPSAILSARAGSTLRLGRLQLQMSNDTIARVTSQTCSLTWKGAALKPLAGGCAWKIPVQAKKARLKLRVDYVYGGTQRTVSWTVIPR